MTMNTNISDYLINKSILKLSARIYRRFLRYHRFDHVIDNLSLSVLLVFKKESLHKFQSNIIENNIMKQNKLADSFYRSGHHTEEIGGLRGKINNNNISLNK